MTVIFYCPIRDTYLFCLSGPLLEKIKPQSQRNVPTGFSVSEHLVIVKDDYDWFPKIRTSSIQT